MNSENPGAETPEDSAAPLMLVSMPQMNDPNFAKTVVLLCDYTSDGAFGLVVNRQMTDPAWTLVKPETPVHVDPTVHLWIGGPVDQQRTWVLMSGRVTPSVPLSPQQRSLFSTLGPTRARTVCKGSRCFMGLWQGSWYR